MQRRRLESAATEYTQLRGLFAIPLGGLCILAALGNWHWGPLRHDWVFLAGVLVLGVTCLPISRYYAEHYGQVTLSSRQQLRAFVAALVAGGAMFGGSLLLRSRASWSLDLPVNTVAIWFGVLTLATYAATVGLRRHHVIIWGTLLLAGALPVWTGDDPSNIGLVLAGVGSMLTGIFDHRLLVRTFGPSQALHLADGDVRP